MQFIGNVCQAVMYLKRTNRVTLVFGLKAVAGHSGLSQLRQSGNIVSFLTVDASAGLAFNGGLITFHGLRFGCGQMAKADLW